MSLVFLVLLKGILTFVFIPTTWAVGWIMMFGVLLQTLKSTHYASVEIEKSHVSKTCKTQRRSLKQTGEE